MSVNGFVVATKESRMIFRWLNATFLRASFSSREQKARRGRQAIARVCAYTAVIAKFGVHESVKESSWQGTRLQREIAHADDSNDVRIIEEALSLIRFPASHKRSHPYLHALLLSHRDLRSSSRARGAARGKEGCIGFLIHEQSKETRLKKKINKK